VPNLTNTKLNILTVNTMDRNGGAAKVALALSKGYREKGHQSFLAVRYRHSSEQIVFQIPNDTYRSRWARMMLDAGSRVGDAVTKDNGRSYVRKLSIMLGEPLRILRRARGLEDFEYPGTWHIFDHLSEIPDIVHCHNLHGGYFDLRSLPWLSRQLPVVLTLHDAWLLSGNCAHSFDCERWKTGCGHCPDIKLPPGIRRDCTNRNWLRKKNIYDNSRLYVATPSHWLMEKVRNSILWPAIIQARVIPNGVDLSVFKPNDRAKARSVLGLDKEAKILLFTSYGIRESIWKDYQTMRKVIMILSRESGARKLKFIGLGEEGGNERLGNIDIEFIPYQEDPQVVAKFYQAADVYVHPARAENFPTSVIESFACGTPVVATKVGGIPEQIEEGGNGFLVEVDDAEGMAARIREVLENEELRIKIGQRAAETARRKFGLERMVEGYLSWYEDIVIKEGNHPSGEHKFGRDVGLENVVATIESKNR
jgi:glycosyltransferase involved in cell wall biosynthesis